MSHDMAEAAFVDRRRFNQVLADIAFGGMAIFLAVVLAMHVLRADVDPTDRGISEYARGDLGWLMVVAWFAIGAAVQALAVGLRRSVAPAPRLLAAVWLLAVAGLALFASGVFVTDVPAGGGPGGATMTGQLHDLAGLVGYVAFLLAALLLQTVFARDPRWRVMAQPTNWAARALLGLFVARVGVVLVRLAGSAGLVQRITWLVLLAWIALLAWHLRRSDTTVARRAAVEARHVA